MTIHPSLLLPAAESETAPIPADSDAAFYTALGYAVLPAIALTAASSMRGAPLGNVPPLDGAAVGTTR